MGTLQLELRRGETMIVNGAAIRFRSKTRVELTGRARFLFGKQVLAPEEAVTPVRRVYLALQHAYVGADEQQRVGGLAAARALAARCGQDGVRAAMDRAVAAAEAGEFYAALKLVREAIRQEDAAGWDGGPRAEPARDDPG